MTHINSVLPERDYTLRSGICRHNRVRLSVVVNVRAPYSAGWNFQQYFYAISYPSHRLTSVRNFTEIVPGEPLSRRLNARVVVKYRDDGHIEGYISETVQDTASGTIND